VDSLSVSTPSLDQLVALLSGGNQQKVVLGRLLATEAKVLILDEPTIGIDVGAKAEIHRLMNELAEQGNGIILISSDLPELLAMSDRILVLYRGRIYGELSGEEATENNLLMYAEGHGRREEAEPVAGATHPEVQV
jgi:ABC-type sugar transport system ATPase subunit